MHLGFWNFYKFHNANKMFGDSVDDIDYGAAAVADHFRKLGHQVNTLDASNEPFDVAVFLDHPTFLDGTFRKFRKSKTRLFLFLVENAVNRPDNYWRWLHGDFHKVFTWDPDWVDNKKYFQFFHTMKIPRNFKIDTSAKTRFCVAVYSQKYANRKKAIYHERINVIRWFEREHPDQFDLYGMRWDKLYFNGHLWRLNVPLSRFYRHFPNLFKVNRFPSCRGPVLAKNEVMRPYKFAIVYENAIYPGYLTEKIFHAFWAGCIPIYLGSPDVLDYIPADTFIDKRHFPTYDQLYKYLASMTDDEYRRRIRAIEDFVNSDRIQPFSAQNLIDLFAKHIVVP
jgi:hypothetical protein